MRRFGLFLLVIGAMLAAAVLPAALAPASAEAEINSIVWLNTAYKGSDPLLGYVQAYEAGSTATLLVSVQNTTGDTITIKGAKVKFDWTGGEYAATTGNYPATLANNESGTATISFTVPATSLASNQFTHSYTVSVDYDKEGGFKAGTQVTGENVSGFTVFYLDNGPVDPSTLRVFLDGTATTAYTLVACDAYPPYITFTNSPDGPGASVSADYQYVESVGTGDGTQTSFQLNYYPVVSATEKIYVGCALSSSLSSPYTLDYDTGKIKFTTAPAYGKKIIANYQYLARWTESGDDFAVYSTDQNGAMAAKQQLDAILGTITSSYPGVATAESRELLTKAAAEEQLGEQNYRAGKLTEAKADFDQALVYVQNALKKDKDPNSFKALEPVGTLLLGIGMLLLALGVVVYVIRKPKGPSSV